MLFIFHIDELTSTAYSEFFILRGFEYHDFLLTLCLVMNVVLNCFYIIFKFLNLEQLSLCLFTVSWSLKV